jgi:hypothetical protein
VRKVDKKKEEKHKKPALKLESEDSYGSDNEKSSPKEKLKAEKKVDKKES